MKVQCDLCREIVVAELAIRGARIEVHCPACDGRFAVDASAPAPAKLDAPSPPAPPAPPAPSSAVADAWARCESAWDDAAAHDALATQAAAHNAYAWVARRYRDRIASDPDDAIATARLAAITRLTEASLRAGALALAHAPRGVPPRPYKNAITILVALVLLAAAGTIYAMVSAPADDADVAPQPVQPVHRR